MLNGKINNGTTNKYKTTVSIVVNRICYFVSDIQYATDEEEACSYFYERISRYYGSNDVKFLCYIDCTLLREDVKSYIVDETLQNLKIIKH